jgi:outer membrane protein TolC
MRILLLLIIIFGLNSYGYGQDTLAISLEEFLNVSLNNAGQIKIADTEIKLAENRQRAAEDQRFLPRLEYRSEHAVVPSVNSPGDFADDRVYLDPDATNDWSKVGIYTRLRISGVQPVFTWGAVRKAVEAAELGVRAVQEQSDATKSEVEILLSELYYSYVFALEIERLLRDAEDKLGEIERAMERQEEEDPAELDESDVFKFQVFKAQFGIQQEEVIRNLEFVKESWNYALRNEDGNIYEPSLRFLDPLYSDLSEINYYQNSAMVNRPELRAIDFSQDGLDMYINALKAQNLPGLYLGFTTTFASTPIRPRQPNPFIRTPENTFNTAVGLTIRQNLNFFQARTSLQRSRLEVKRLEFIEDAARDGIMIELNDSYRIAAISKAKVERTQEALKIAKEWLRSEQLDYDLGFGESKDLIDAVRQELELRLEEKQSIFEYNQAMAKLNKSAGLPLNHQSFEN